MENMDSITEIEMLLKKDNNGNEILSCQINEKQFSIDFTEEDQAYLKQFFMTIIKELKNNKIHFVLNEIGSLNNELLLNVSKEYINDLNCEIDAIYETLQEILKLKQEE